MRYFIVAHIQLQQLDFKLNVKKRKRKSFLKLKRVKSNLFIKWTTIVSIVIILSPTTLTWGASFHLVRIFCTRSTKSASVTLTSVYQWCERWNGAEKCIKSFTLRFQTQRLENHHILLVFVLLQLFAVVFISRLSSQTCVDVVVSGFCHEYVVDL